MANKAWRGCIHESLSRGLHEGKAALQLSWEEGREVCVALWNWLIFYDMESLQQINTITKNGVKIPSNWSDTEFQSLREN